MDTFRYRKMLGALDDQLCRVKAEAERRERREKIEHDLKMVEHWLDGLTQRKAELEKYGAEPEIDVVKEIDNLRSQKDTLEAELLELENLKDAVAPEDAGELDALAREIEEATLPDDPKHAWSIFEEWALRWRVIAQRFRDTAFEREPRFRRVYAKIRERMDEQPDRGWFIAALDPKRKDDWNAALQIVRDKLAALEAERQASDAKEAAAEKAIIEVVQAQVDYEGHPDEEQERLFRHAVRNAAKYDHLRDEVAVAVKPHKEFLGKEFAFLWKNGDPETKSKGEKAEKGRKLTNREIVARMLRRMRSNNLIGGCHGPRESMWNGFPEHDQGRAKEAMELLIRHGVMRCKSTQIGDRVSIEPRFVGKAMAFVERNEPMEIGGVDAWCS